MGGDEEGNEGVGDFTGVLSTDRLTGGIAYGWDWAVVTDLSRLLLG